MGLHNRNSNFSNQKHSIHCSFTFQNMPSVDIFSPALAGLQFVSLLSSPSDQGNVYMYISIGINVTK